MKVIEQKPIDIIYEDAFLLAINKVSGISVHRGLDRSPETLVDLVKAHLGTDVVFPVNRLDRPTSGIVIFAKDSETAKVLQATPATKKYLALVRGICPESGRIDHPVPKDESAVKVYAVTDFRRISFAEIEPRSVSLVEVVPVTGRFHQIRRHLNHINHPIIGDTTYGKASLNIAFRERYGIGRLALHAFSFETAHPATKIPLIINAPLPEDLEAAFKSIGVLAVF